MQKKILSLFGLVAGLVVANQASALPEHNASHRGDPEFSISSADGNYKIGLHGLLQERNEFKFSPSSTNNRAEFNFYLPAARIAVGGTAFDPAFSYMFQAQFEKAEIAGGGQGSSILVDYYLNFAINKKWAQLRVGKFNLPFSRPLMFAKADTQFDASYASKKASVIVGNHDVGLMVYNGSANSFEYALALVNVGVVARVGYNHGDVDGYQPTDFAGGGFRFGLGLGGFMPTNYTSLPKELRPAFDFITKFHGFAANGVFYFKRATPDNGGAPSNNLSAGLDMGYLIKSKCEPVARYSWEKDGTDNRHEILLGLNHYHFGHHLKTQIYAGANLANAKPMNYMGGLGIQLAL